jgi:hypothetical protein
MFANNIYFNDGRSLEQFVGIIAIELKFCVKTVSRNKNIKLNRSGEKTVYILAVQRYIQYLLTHQLPFQKINRFNLSLQIYNYFNCKNTQKKNLYRIFMKITIEKPTQKKRKFPQQFAFIKNLFSILHIAFKQNLNYYC